MSAAGLPMDGHIGDHFGPGGLCQCPCDQCTTRPVLFCLCLDCPCDEFDPQAPRHSRAGTGPEWITVPFTLPGRRP